MMVKAQKGIDASQAWFWTPEWQAGEAEACAELQRGEGELFGSADALLASLDELPTHRPR